MIQSVFASRSFKEYQISSLNESRSPVQKDIYHAYAQAQTTVFLSHKHDDLDDLKDIIGFLQKKYSVKVYIDSSDASMPSITSGKTGENLKKRIKECDKFILLATNGAIESKWCNWELGYGDANKFRDHIALFPIKPQSSEYKGSEYISIYPSIRYYSSGEEYNNGQAIEEGYYVAYPVENSLRVITPLKTWFTERK